MTYQKGEGDFTLLHKGKIYRFPTEAELYEFIQEEANTNDITDTLIVTDKSQRKSVS